MADVKTCAICARRLSMPRKHVDTCGERCFRALLRRQRAPRAASTHAEFVAGLPCPECLREQETGETPPSDGLHTCDPDGFQALHERGEV
jgi:hypothetical protein